MSVSIHICRTGEMSSGVRRAKSIEGSDHQCEWLELNLGGVEVCVFDDARRDLRDLAISILEATEPLACDCCGERAARMGATTNGRTANLCDECACEHSTMVHDLKQEGELR